MVGLAVGCLGRSSPSSPHLLLSLQGKNYLLKHTIQEPFKTGMHNSDFMAGQKNVAETFAGQIG